MPDVSEARMQSSRHLRLDLAKHPDLEIEILGHRLDDEVRARDAVPRDSRAPRYRAAVRSGTASAVSTAAAAANPWRALARLPGSASKADTFRPARASVAAMPGPMVPRPIDGRALRWLTIRRQRRSAFRLLVGVAGPRVSRARPRSREAPAASPGKPRARSMIGPKQMSARERCAPARPRPPGRALLQDLELRASAP